ncbi:sugar ABC transporter ATP-binding protein [Alginatibacterium sediminis]|uniref:Autoinducer 2 import ATP-binding protein LsrA n=1 Tax=Alginatibacterium sediminis TaxID=2164068 RepID=A0A420EB69_9ALTE|nr:sugar ABC transporter ATP-binding protein [Alginatibacterium sediminis]RKF17926.1 sugar ABC transporter ATP-binding protein [Alginatibacterium sediminis]
MEQSALRISKIIKSFDGIKALKGLSLSFNKGEIVGLVGSNGAGKSTLLNVIWGAYAPDSGDIFINGEQVKKISPTKAQELGISIIFQHRRLMPYMTVAENIFIDNMPKKHGIVDFKKMSKDAQDLLKMLSLDIDSSKKVEELSAEEKQLVEIVKACSKNPKILLMDEPTTALRQGDVDRLFTLMRTLKSRGCSVVFISHRLKEVIEISDRISIIRDGANVSDGPSTQYSPDRIVEEMSGITATDFEHQRDVTDSSFSHAGQEVLLRTEGLKVANSQSISFELHKGEILGFAGLGGSGVEDIFESLYGLKTKQAGDIEIENQHATIRSPMDAIKHGLGFVSEDRQLNGEFLELSVKDNICIPSGQKKRLFSMINRSEETLAAASYIEKLNIKTESSQKLIKNLSGGNQQKAIIAKWLQLQSKIIIMCEPTAGIDVAAKSDVNALIQQIAEEGKGILYTSSYITELMHVSDRIIVVYQGQMFKEFSRSQYDHNQIYLAMNGIEEQSGVNDEH